MRIATAGDHLPESAWLDDALRSLGHQVAPRARIGAVDAVLVHDPDACDIRQLERIRAAGATLLLRAYGDPERLDAHRAIAPCCHFTLTSGFADCVDHYRHAGARALTFLPAAPPNFADAAPAVGGSRPIDLLFVGRLDGRERRHRRELLDRAARQMRVHVESGPDRKDADALEALHGQSKLALHWDRIAINREGITRGTPGTRPFAGPAAGCVLFTHLMPWLSQCYDVAEEVAAFSGVDHALEVAAEYLRDPDRRERTAAAGQARCLAAHTYRRRAEDLVALLGGSVPLHLEVLSLGPWYQRIELPGGVATSLMTMSNVARWRRLEPHLPDLNGRAVVDFGANAGFFAVKCLERGAARAIAIDRSALACRQARFVIETMAVGSADVVHGDADVLAGQTADLVLMLAVLHHHADIEPLLRAAVACSPQLVLEWQVRELPFHHSVERVTAVLRSLEYDAVLCDGGPRPIVVAAPVPGARSMKRCRAPVRAGGTSGAS